MSDNPHAFPNDGRGSSEFAGMTLRDYFAAKAMQAIIAACDSSASDGTRNLAYSTAAVDAFKYADAMLDARQPE